MFREPRPEVWIELVELVALVAAKSGAELGRAAAAVWRVFFGIRGWDGRLDSERHPVGWARSYLGELELRAVELLRRRARAPEPVTAEPVTSSPRENVAAASSILDMLRAMG